MIRTWAVLALAVGIALPALAIERVSVAQLEGILAKAQGMSDTDVAAELSTLQLTERFSSARIEHWRTSLPGARSQRALTGLADRSTFLTPPSTDIPSTPAPDLAEQRHIMGLAATYVGNVIPQLPRFYASRTITHFEDAPGTIRVAALDDTDSLHAFRITRATVLYRDGQEIVQAAPLKVEKSQPAEQGLRAWGVFGPILGLAMVDAAENKLAWERWEQSPAGRVAVFRYAVPRERSHYEVRYCCVAETYGLESSMFHQMSAYHGEIAVDPSNGEIKRLTIQAELGPDDPIARADTAVEYGPVELGGTTYTCPTRSISISVAKTLRNMEDPSGHSWVGMGPLQMLVNHAEFDRYHLFRSDSRILSDDEERTAGITPDATLPQAEPTDLLPAEEDLADAPAATPATTGAAGSAPQTAQPIGTGDESQEITTTAAAALPDKPEQASEQPPDTQDSGITLRVNTRLVDVNVVALDKKGHPVTDLKPEDFEVYDNGVKQNVRSFMQTSDDAAPQASYQAPSAAAPGEFSNHTPQDAATARAEENTLVLLLDAGNLDFNDVADARQQMVRFLKALPAGERVALYTMKYHAYQVLHEPSTDHVTLADLLAKWLPVSQDLANGQDEEKRNRQQIETVHSPEDLLSVNGNDTLDNVTQTEALDPKLRELGSRPVPNALDLLIDVAHHLSAIPGHKNLVWVTSDNALADWNKASFNLDKGARSIEPAALRTQEALNKAHVTIYPLDASKLEANVVNADVGRRNVVLTPTFQMPILNELAQEGTEMQATQDVNRYGMERDFGGTGHLYAQMQQDTHSVQGVFREVADATGGRVFRRSSDIIGELNDVVAEGHATYLLGFSPAQPADGQYHRLTVKLATHRDAALRFRSGYQYDAEPATLKQRFARTVWDPSDASEIGISTRIITDASGSALRVTVAGSDLSLTQKNAVWTGKLDIFLVRRDQEALRARVTGLTVGLRLKQATYQRAMKEGLTFDQRLNGKQDNGSLRVVVVDVNSGRIGSITVPTTALIAQR